MSKNRRHHYVPRFHLEGFVDPKHPPYVWVYEKGRTQIRPVSTKDAAVLKDYYEPCSDVDARNQISLEQVLSTVESRVAPVFKRIVDEHPISAHDKCRLAVFLALMLLRVPAFRNNYRELLAQTGKRILEVTAQFPGALEGGLKDRENEMGQEATPEKTREIRKFILTGEYDVVFPEEATLDALNQNSCKELASVLWNMKWRFVRSTTDFRFVTCDNPLVYRIHPTKAGPACRGLLDDTVQVTFPISKKCAIFASWRNKNEGHINGTNAIVREINRNTVWGATRYVFASERSETLMHFVQQYEGTGYKWSLT